MYGCMYRCIKAGWLKFLSSPAQSPGSSRIFADTTRDIKSFVIHHPRGIGYTFHRAGTVAASGLYVLRAGSGPGGRTLRKTGTNKLKITAVQGFQWPALE